MPKRETVKEIGESMRRAARTDDNHAAIVKALRKAGCSVRSTAQLGQGFPDLCLAKAGHCVLAEIKDGTRPPSERQLTADQKEFIATWKSPVMILTSVEDAIKLANAMSIP